MQRMICDHIGFFTHNAESLARFYIDVLGFNMKQVSMLPKSIAEMIFGIDSDCRFMKLYRDEFVLEIFEPLFPDMKKRLSGKTGINHWGYCVENRAAFVGKLRKRGQEIIEVDRNGHLVYFLTDPDGNRIEIRECRE